MWLLDSGAFHHVTNDLVDLSLHDPYDGTEELLIGDGKVITIENISSTNLSVSSRSLVLNNFLHAPSISSNIISISQFCHDNNVSVEFSSSCFSVKDISMGRVLVQGPLKQGVYEVLSTTPFAYTTRATPSLLTLHHRLGHPSLQILKQICSRIQVSISKNIECNCHSCNVNKMHRLPFAKFTISFTAPLQYIYTDLRTFPILSFDSYKYYIIFVDHFTKYIIILSNANPIQILKSVLFGLRL